MSFMKAKKAVGLIFGILVILGGLFFIIYFEDELFGQNDYESELLEFKQQVKEDLRQFNMIKRIKDNKGLVKPRDDFTTIEQKQVNK